MICEVYLFDVPYHIDKTFDYLAPENAEIGNIVKVPFGKGDTLRFGVIFKFKEQSSEQNVKPVHSVLGDRVSLNEEMLGLCLFLKEHTLCTFGEAARTVLPPGALSEKLNVKYRKRCELLIKRSEAAEILSGKSKIRSEGQKEIIRYLMEINSADYELIKSLPGVTIANISALFDKGIIKITASEEVRNPYAKYAAVRDTAPIMLTRAQSAAYEKIESLYLDNAPRAALLYGVTGSGKTKVIMKAIDKVISEGKSVIMLVPEIALTPQTVSIFCRRYGENVAVIHSSLSQGERLDAFRRIKKGDTKG